MKEKELIEKMMFNKLTEDEFFNYVEDKMIEEGGFKKEDVKYTIKLIRDPEFCKKETGYTAHELYLIRQGFTPEQARYIEENPCILGPREECDHYRSGEKCFGCTNTNGFLYWKTEPEKKLKPTKTLDELKKKSVAIIVHCDKDEKI